MKKNILIVILVFITLSVFSQKKEIYLDDNLNKITKKEYEKNNKNNKFSNLQFDLDSLIANVKVQRIKKGQLTLSEFNSLKNELTTISNKAISKNNLIIINYYHGPDKYNTLADYSYIKKSHKKYLKKLNTLDNVSQFFMYKSSKGISNYGKQLNWIKDKFNTFEKKFLPLNYPSGSYILIDEKGSFYVQKGEYSLDEIFKLIKNKKRTFKNK